MDFTSLIELGPIQTNLTELIAVIFGLLSVWFMKKESILAFPFGIINVSGYVYLSLQKDFYALAGINVFFAMMSIYGWYNWSRQGENHEGLSISRCNKHQLSLYLLAFALFFVIIWWLLKKFTDSPIPMWDSFTTSLYIIAMWMLAKKKIENWIAWIIGDTVSIFLYAIPYGNNQANLFSSLQFLIFTIIAVSGFLEWRGKLLKASGDAG
ncbi:MAG: nicotinamide riboside transporter PnuC [Syntrophothermus sp.]